MCQCQQLQQHMKTFALISIACLRYKYTTFNKSCLFFFVLAELADLPLIRLDFSCNKITEIPPAYRKLRQLQHIILDNNPMQSPPAQVCPCIDVITCSLDIVQFLPQWPVKLISLSSVYNKLCGFFIFQICLKGKVHIFKYLNIQACRMDKKPDTLDLPSLGKRCLPQPLTDRYYHMSHITHSQNIV